MPSPKEDLRRTMRARLRELTGRDEKSAAICRRISALPEYRAARTVALFDAMASEPSLAALWPLEGKRAAYPRVTGNELLLLPVADPAHLPAAARPGHHREPGADGEPLPPAAIEVILVPGLAFTRAGLRMGRGGGHYDRLLACLPASTVRIGLCFGLQIREELPAEPHDMTMHRVVTEDGVWSGGNPRI
jgi:5-formyltetrahydrofolate cyclo-ligase